MCSWEYLVHGIDKVMNELEQGMNMQLYMGVYTFVVSKNPVLLFISY